MILSQRCRTGPGHELAGLHYIRQDLCVHHEDGGGANRGSWRQGCLRWTCNFLPSEVRRRTFKLLSPRIWIHVMSLNLTARAREKECFRNDLNKNQTSNSASTLQFNRPKLWIVAPRLGCTKKTNHENGTKTDQLEGTLLRTRLSRWLREEGSMIRKTTTINGCPFLETTNEI